jgi:NAD(P)-dependent dehydrogenase (short-subunit alcohol dehydrogenase family)
MADIFGLGGQHALVTGASSGLGRHFAGVLGAAGARVTVAARREAALADTVGSIRAGGAKAQSVRMDVTDMGSIENAFAEAETGFGPVTILINNAGVVQMTKALALEWARHGIRVNALAPGYIETELNDAFFGSDAGKALIRRIPQRRLGEARELDGPLLLLASEAGSYMTGSIVAVDGGHLVSGL